MQAIWRWHDILVCWETIQTLDKNKQLDVIIGCMRRPDIDNITSKVACSAAGGVLDMFQCRVYRLILLKHGHGPGMNLGF